MGFTEYRANAAGRRLKTAAPPAQECQSDEQRAHTQRKMSRTRRAIFASLVGLLLSFGSGVWVGQQYLQKPIASTPSNVDGPYTHQEKSMAESQYYHHTVVSNLGAGLPYDIGITPDGQVFGAELHLQRYAPTNYLVGQSSAGIVACAPSADGSLVYALSCHVMFGWNFRAYPNQADSIPNYNVGLSTTDGLSAATRQSMVLVNNYAFVLAANQATIHVFRLQDGEQIPGYNAATFGLQQIKGLMATADGKLAVVGIDVNDFQWRLRKSLVISDGTLGAYDNLLLNAIPFGPPSFVSCALSDSTLYIAWLNNFLGAYVLYPYNLNTGAARDEILYGVTFGGQAVVKPVDMDWRASSAELYIADAHQDASGRVIVLSGLEGATNQPPTCDVTLLSIMP